MDATPTGKAQAAQPESIAKSILSPSSAPTALAQKISLFVGFPLISCLFLDSFPGLPVSLTVPLVSTDGTNEETCCLLGGFLIRRKIFLTVWPLVKARRSLLAFATFAFALRLRIGSSRTWELAVSQLPSFGSLPSCDHTRHTRSSCHRTSLTCLPCPSPCRLSCLPWSCWQRRRHPWASLLTHARLLEGSFRSSVSVSLGSQWTKPTQQGDHGKSSNRSSGCTPCVSISTGSAHHRQISGEPLAIFARVSPCLQPRRVANLRRREQPLQQLYLSQWVARMILVIQSSPCITPHFSLVQTLQ